MQVYFHVMKPNSIQEIPPEALYKLSSPQCCPPFMLSWPWTSSVQERWGNGNITDHQMLNPQQLSYLLLMKAHYWQTAVPVRSSSADSVAWELGG